MDFLDQIIAYESGELENDEILDLFQGLVDSGTINHLQGSYGRMAQVMVEEGLIT